MGWLHFGRFFTNSSGHLAHTEKFAPRLSIKKIALGISLPVFSGYRILLQAKEEGKQGPILRNSNFGRKVVGQFFSGYNQGSML
jgi:hypothetical protein